jgi:predicted amidohydrolase
VPDGPTYAFLRDLAARHRIVLHGGSYLESEAGGERLYNTTVAFGRDGEELARYRKIHLFDVVTPEGREYRESATVGRGSEIVTYDAGATAARRGSAARSATTSASASSTGRSRRPAPRSWPCRRPSPSRPAATTGRCC